MTALITGIPYELDVDGCSDGYSFSWPEAKPECPNCGDELSPRPDVDPPSLAHAEPIYFLACDCGQRFEVIGE